MEGLRIVKKEKIEPVWNADQIFKTICLIKEVRGGGSEKVDMITAALMLGMGRVAEATKLRGIYP